VSYGHADKLAAITASAPAVGSGKPTPPIDAVLYRRDDVCPVLAEHDITALYRVLKDAGVTQRQIAELTGQSQSEVSEILKGRRVLSYDLLVRIAEGLGIPRELMGLSYGEHSAYGGEVEVIVSGEVGEDVQRRDVLAAGFLATFGSVPSFVALPDRSAAPREIPLPSRLGASDVAEVRNTTAQLRITAQQCGGQARAASATATHYRRLTAVPATEQVAHSLGSALAELDELAGWCCFDSGLDRHARWHYRTAVDLARRVGDDYRAASALRCAGLVDARRDRPDDAMKLYQIAGVKLAGSDSDLDAWLHAVSAGALADMGHEQAADHLARAQDGWSATEAVERADQNYQAALVHVRLGRLDLAEQLQPQSTVPVESAQSGCSRPSCAPPSTSKRGSRAGWAWLSRRSTLRRACTHCEPVSGSTRSPPRWTHGPAATRGSWPGWPGRSRPRGRSQPGQWGKRRSSVGARPAEALRTPP